MTVKTCACGCHKPLLPGAKRFRMGHHMRLAEHKARLGVSIRLANRARVLKLHAQWRAVLRAQFGPLSDRELDIARVIHRRSHALGYSKGWRSASRDVA